jgi:hypothetical protein
VLIEQDAHPSHADPRAIAARLVADVPADQALGLRLIALARAAAEIHLNKWSEVAPNNPPLARSQAARLVEEVRT